MSTLTEAPTEPELEPVARERAWTHPFVGYGLLALLAYVPVLRSDPGKVAADTKTYLYLDPSRLMSRAIDMWDPNVGMGTVTHQTIGYLFPMGPYYWAMDKVGVPDWIAQRLWLGTLMFVAALGMLYLFRTFGIRGPGVPLAAVAFMLTPYLLDYSARISVLLLPWAALPWLIGLVRKALDDDRGWRYPAIFALVIQVIGGVNATALLFAGIAPVAWILYAWLFARDVKFSRALVVTAKIGALTIATSLWWIAGLAMQGSYGLNILKYTETVRAVARTSLPNEVLRGLGYWFFYGQDRLGPWIEAARSYTQQPLVILAGYGLASLAILAFAWLRWRHRAYFALLLVIGVVIAVGPHPYDSPSILGSIFKAFANGSTAGLALRSTGRVVPLVVLSMSVFLGLGINALVRWLRQTRRPLWIAYAAIGLVAVMILLNFPALFQGTYYGKNLERAEDIPGYWYDAAHYLDAQPHSTRVLELPGADFASYRWGNTVDPITPGIMDRPYVARELIPYGSAPSADLLNALDRRIQERVFDPRGFAALAARMGVGSVVLRNDIQWERYDLVSPDELQRDFADVPGLDGQKAFGPPEKAQLARHYINEYMLGAPANQRDPKPVVVYQVPGATPIVRAESTHNMLVVAGDGEGLIDTADVGLLDGAGAILYSAAFPDDTSLRKAVQPDAVLVLTDNNRKRARRWSTVRDNTGETEFAGEKPLRTDESDARLEVFPDARATAFTTTEQRGVKSLQSTSYGNTISLTPEDRAARAFDGDLTTAWRAGAFGFADGERLRLGLKAPISTDHVNLVQPLTGSRDRYITQLALRFDDGRPVKVRLGPESRTPAGQTVKFGGRRFRTLDLEVVRTNFGSARLQGGTSAVGFAEVRLHDNGAKHDVHVDEVVRMPTDLLTAIGKRSLGHPLVVVMNRQRGVPVPPRSDEELALSREFKLPTARSFGLTGTARVTSDAKPANIDRVLGFDDAAHGGITTSSKEFLFGCVLCRPASAIDGDATTAWQTPLVGVRNQWADYKLARPVTFDHLDLQLVADGRHSVPTKLKIQAGGKTRIVDVPDVVDGDSENATARTRVEFPSLTGRDVRITIEDVREERAFSFFSGSRVLLPAAVAEWGIPGVQLENQPAAVQRTCRTDLLELDGRPIGVRIVGNAGTADASGPLSIVPCDPDDPAGATTIHLGPGRHVLRATDGRRTAIQLDRIALASAAGGAALAAEGGRVTGLPSSPPAGPTVKVLSQGRTAMKVRVSGATEPFYMVLGESANTGWKASAKGDAKVEDRQLVDGYANGWLVRPGRDGTFEMSIVWTPQRAVNIALILSLLAALLCVVITAVTWRRARLVRTVAPGDDDVELVSRARPLGTEPTRAWRIAAPIVTGCVAAVISAPWIGVLAALFVALAVFRPPLRVALGVTSAVLIGTAGLYIAVQQVRHNYPPIFEWPTVFPWARSIAWLAVALVLGDAVVHLVRRASAAPEGSDEGGDPPDGGPGGDGAGRDAAAPMPARPAAEGREPVN